MSSELSKKVNELSEIIDFMYFYKTNIVYFQSSVINVLKRFAKEKNNSSLRFIDDCLDLCKNKDFPYAWVESLKENSLCSCEATEILFDFGKRIGTSDIETQIKYIDYYITEISRYLRCAEEKERENKKLYIILGTSAGLLAAIMII